MVRHQAVSPDLYAMAMAAFSHYFKVGDIIIIIQKGLPTL
jgi:hypothetical protein